MSRHRRACLPSKVSCFWRWGATKDLTCGPKSSDWSNSGGDLVEMSWPCPETKQRQWWSYEETEEL
ncbi:hypothetical protein ACLOJK_022883 [Asimina triloba]